MQPQLLHHLHYKDLSLELVHVNLINRYFRFYKLLLIYIHENMMLPKLDVFVSLRNDGPSMDPKDKLWSMYVQGDGSRSAHDGDDYTTNGEYDD